LAAYDTTLFEGEDLALRGVAQSGASARADMALSRSCGPDWDHDGMEDACEISHFGNIDVSDGSGDYDHDGLTDLEEFGFHSDSVDADTDEDGLQDGAEDANANGVVDAGETDPLNPDTDGDGIRDGTELGYTIWS
jgi:hypothetical protein